MLCTVAKLSNVLHLPSVKRDVFSSLPLKRVTSDKLYEQEVKNREGGSEKEEATDAYFPVLC